MCVRGIGAWANGTPDWGALRAVARGEAQPAAAAPKKPAPALLPPNERRRAPDSVLLALTVAQAACDAAQADAATTPSIFASMHGDLAITDAIARTLADVPTDLSPTRFHNSVHNAAAGYWHIAVASRAASTSLGAFDASFGAGLIEAATSVALSGAPILLVASDTPYPEPLHAARPLPDNFGIALVLGATRSQRSLAALSIELVPGASVPTACADASLEALRATIPAACGLPLLQALARDEEQVQTLALTYLPTLTLKVTLQRVRLHALA